MSEHWYAIATFSGAEWQVHDGLKKVGIRSWMPYEIKSVRGGRWKHGRVRPLFEGYVFVMTDRKSLRPIRLMSGVQTIVFSLEAPLTIPPDIVASMMARFSEGPITDAGQQEITLADDGRRMLMRGPFERLIVQIARVISFERVEVWGKVMGQTIKLVVNADDLGAIPSEKRCA